MLADRWQAEELPHINMTPMVDVVLCLLVFFMVATRLYDWDDTQFEVKVPQVGSAAPLTAAPDDLELTIEGPGKVSAVVKTFDLAGLTELLRKAKAGYADQAVQIRGDAALPQVSQQIGQNSPSALDRYVLKHDRRVNEIERVAASQRRQAIV